MTIYSRTDFLANRAIVIALDNYTLHTIVRLVEGESKQKRSVITRSLVAPLRGFISYHVIY